MNIEKKKRKAAQLLVLIQQAGLTPAEVYAASYYGWLESSAEGLRDDASDPDATPASAYQALCDDGDLQIESEITDALTTLYPDINEA